MSDHDPSVDESAQNAIAPWSWTATEVVSTEAALLPFLVHLAAAKDDVESISRLLAEDGLLSPENQAWNIAGGIVNCLDPGSGRSPLHIAALNGNTRSAEALLKTGALVHLRDSLGHTALYYASCPPFDPCQH
jgi:lysophospholipase